MLPIAPVPYSQRAQESLGAAFDLLPIGIGIFDAKSRLVYCNKSFGSLRFLPDSICAPGTALVDIVRFIAARGDYGPGELATLTQDRFAAATSARQWEVEQEAPGGRRLKISHTPTPEGGVMITYADVTEARATERRLRENEERYGLVSQAVAEGIYDWNVVTNALYVSERVMEILGLEGNLTSGDWYARVHPDDAEEYRCALRDCFRGHQSKVACQYRIRNRDGAYRWIEDHGLPVRGTDGRAVRLVGCVSDVTQRHIMEQALRESEQRYAAALQAINESVYEWNIETGEMYYSPRLYGALQLTTAELKTREDWLNRIHPEDLPGFMVANIDHLKGRTERLEAEYRYRHSDGTWHWARQHGVASRHSNGRAYLMVGSTGDITTEKRLAADLQSARHQLHDALETIGEGFALFDAEDRLVMCNTRYRSWLPDVSDLIQPGNSYESFMRAAVDAGLFPFAQGNPDEFMAEIQARRNNPSGPYELLLGSGVWLQISDYKMKDGMHVSVGTDITLQKRQQEEVTGARAEAEAALKRLQTAQQQLIVQGKMASLGQLTAGIAHEMKNPLNFVNNFAALSREMLEELKELAAPFMSETDGRGPQLEEVLGSLDGNLARISEHGARADRIVKNMLKHSRTDEMQRGLTEANKLVEESVNLGYHSARVEMKNFEVHIERQFDPCAGSIDCFPQDLSRALLNIISNALYAAHKNSAGRSRIVPTVTVTTAGTDAAVSIRVRDTGEGIRPELRDRLFTPFFTTKPPGEGTGLGLSLAYDIIVKQHGGAIDVASETGQFTEFAITLPRSAPAQEIAGGM